MNSFRLVARLPVLLFVVLLTTLTAGPFWKTPGLPEDAIDTLMHLHRSAAVARAFAEGVYWPRWYPVVYDGLGAPTFHHYGPGLYWLIAFIHAFGLGLDQTLKIVVSVALLLAGFGVYAWLRYAFSPIASLVGSAMYMLHPQILTRAFYFEGSFARLLGLFLLPICLWSITALHHRARLIYWVAAVISVALLVLTHGPTAVVGAVILSCYWVLLAAGYRNPAGLFRVAVAALIVVILTAAFWLPALADRIQVRVDAVRQGLFTFHSRYLFLHLWQVFSFQSPILDSRAGNTPLSLLTANFGAASFLACGVGFASSLFGNQKARRVWAIMGCAFALITIALTLSISEPLWNSITWLQLIPFPYRLLGIATLGVLPASAAAVDVWPKGRRVVPASVLVLASFVVLFPYAFPSHLSHTGFNRVQNLTVEDTQHFEQTTGSWGTTAFNEYLVREADWGIIAGETSEPQASRMKWLSPHEALVDLSEQSEPLLLRLHYHTGWSAGERATLTPGPAGWTQVAGLQDRELPLLIRWDGTTWQRWGERIGLLGLIFVLGCFMFHVARTLRRREKSVQDEASKCPVATPPRSSGWNLWAMAGLVFILVLVQNALDLSRSGPFIQHSPPGRIAFPVNGQPITLSDDMSTNVTLLGWKLLSKSTPRPGDVVRVRLYWQPHEKIDEDLRSFVHLYSPSMQRSWATDIERTGNVPNSRRWDPDRYYVDDLRLLLPSDLPPATFSLVTGLTSSAGRRLQIQGSLDNVLELTTIDVAPIRPGLLQKESPSTKAFADTNDGLRIQGYDLLSDTNALSLRLFWETDDRISTNWIVYVHLYDDQGVRVAQFDGPALAGLLPTSQWHTNSLYIDRRSIQLPTDLEMGDALLRIGLYNSATGERLPFLPLGGRDGHFREGELLIPLAIESDGNWTEQ